MYKAFSSELLWFPDRSIKDDIPLAVKYGYEGISYNIKKESTAFSPQQFNDLLQKNRLKPSGFALPVEFRTDRETYEAGLKVLLPCCKFAQKTGTNICTTYIMSFSDTFDYKSNFNLHKERLTVIANILGEYGINFGLEFLGPPSLYTGKAYKFINGLDSLNELIDAIGASNLGYLLDVFHWDMAGQVFDDFKKLNKTNQIVAAHFNDAPKNLAREEQPNHQRELPGTTGVLRINEFIKGLQSFDYKGPVLVEPFNKALKEMAFEDAVKEAKAAMDNVWPTASSM